ncbi:MAG: ATP-dependent RecD-like DNA helicase [Candidatus Synoicihabitans palmerolidicus]|nr:ATP-dependent RecD-like DNA helicase [Candidatus Synoicihabitans palmerolidicus]
MSSESLTGVLERIIFSNEENHYTIADFRAGDGAEKTPIVGTLPGVQCGETLHLEGEWTRHSQHGTQFKISSFRSTLPSTVYGIRKYLGSGLVPGIGKVYANKIVDAFGTDTFRVLSEESARLRTVPGIGKKRATGIKSAWDEQRAFRDLYIFLQTYGVTTSQCVKLNKAFGADAQRILQTEPYRAAREIDGIGFKTADRIAINLGFANDAPPRLDAGLIYALETLQEEGHTALREVDLIAHATEMLETSRDRLEARVTALLEAFALVRHWPAQEADPLSGSGFIQLPILHRAEEKIARVVQRLEAVPSGLPPIKIDAAIVWAQPKASIEFAVKQAEAVRTALAHKISILTGGPGTGKTTILRALVDILRAKKVRLHLAAPTGRAAQRLAETTGGFASTIHRLLKFDPSKGHFMTNEDHPLSTDFLVVDEASMLDTRLASALLQAVPSSAHLLLVGDIDQLPSVGAGNVLQDLIATQLVAVTRLDVIHRQKGQSGIVTTAHAINDGNPTLPLTQSELDGLQAWSDLSFIPATDQQDCVNKVLRLCRETLPRLHPWLNPSRDIQVLAPMHRGTAGVGNLNASLQEALNPGRQGIKFAAGEFRPGDKIIQLRNNYDKNLFNGDIGVIVSTDGINGTLTARFDTEEHTFERAEFGDLGLAYAISIHKSQGSEYPVVVIPLLKAHFMMLQRNLLYTAITRGKKKVYLVGEPAAYGMAVRNHEAKVRSTHLKQKIAALA